MLFNLHTHTSFSDGSADPSKYIEEAVRQGFHTLGISDHAPVPFENTFAIREERLGEYIQEIQSQKSKVESRKSKSETSYDRPLPTAHCQLLLGLEADYIPGITRPFQWYRDNYPVDYLIGSVHLVRNGNDERLWFIDGPEIAVYDEGLRTIFGGNTMAAVTAYYRQIREMIVNEKPDIIGHLDKIKMYNRNRYFSEHDSWYVALVDETLGLIRDAGCVVEVNTRGIYKKRSKTLFPGPDILTKLRRLNIPITLTSDAHKPEEISNYFAEAKILLREIGFNCQYLLMDGTWQKIELL